MTRSKTLIVGSLVAAFGVAGCEQLPNDGPGSGAVHSGATATLVNTEAVTFDYALVDISRFVLEYVTDPGPGSLYKSFGGGRGGAPEIRVGVGDVIQVSIFESAAGGLFVPADAGSRPGNYVTLPTQTVDRSGFITVPYAGLIPAGGRSLPQIQKDIEARLANRAIEPQAVVALVEQRATQVAVVGEVNGPGKFQINAAGDRILDMIAKAGGAKYQGFETFVTLQRAGRKATVFFNTLISNPSENIFLAPGDTVYVYREQRQFMAFGATGLSGQFSFDQEKLNLSEAVAKAGGLLDSRADPGQVFLYRLEDCDTLRKMGADLSKFPPETKRVPVIYRANFRDPSSFFFAQKFPMRDKDVIFVATAEAVEVAKFVTFLRTVTGGAAGVTNDLAVTKSSVKYLTK